MSAFPEKKLNTMLAIMSELCKVLKKENSPLKQQRQSECSGLLDQKTNMSQAYEKAFAYFSEHPDVLKALPDPQKRLFKKAALTLNGLTEENARLLKINIEATSRLLGAIVQDVKEQSKNTSLYTPQGEVETDAGNPAALTFNQVL